MILELAVVLAIIIITSMLWFVRSNPRMNKKLKKLMEKFECCV